MDRLGRFGNVEIRYSSGGALIGMGAFLLVLMTLRNPESFGIVHYVIVWTGVALVLVGIGLMVSSARRDAIDISKEVSVEGKASPELAVVQLSKNYEVLRSQTTQGFLLSGSFMALGFLVILAGAAGQMFGFQSQSGQLTTVAGVIMEFVSGTSLLVYRLNFKRLNETTDKLDSTWRVLTAYRLAADLPEQTKADATLRLIDALMKS